MPQWKSSSPILHREKEAALCVAFSPDDGTVCVGYFDGHVRAFDVASHAEKFTFAVADEAKKTTPSNPPPSEKQLAAAERSRRHPVTAVAFRPTAATHANPLLLAASSSGRVERRALPGLALSQAFACPCEVYAAAYRDDGVFFALVGSDAIVRVYDDGTGTCLHELKTTLNLSPVNTHAQRLQSVCFSQSNPSVVLAAGWGNVLHAFDLREPAGSKAHHTDLLGPFMIGGGLDARGGEIVMASFRAHDRLQTLSDIPNTPQCIAAMAAAHPKPRSIPWPDSNISFMPACARISPPAADKETFIALGGGGGLGLTEAGIIISQTTKETVAEFPATSCVNACAFSNLSPLLAAFVDAKGTVTIARTHAFYNVVLVPSGHAGDGSGQEWGRTAWDTSLRAAVLDALRLNLSQMLALSEADLPILPSHRAALEELRTALSANSSSSSGDLAKAGAKRARGAAASSSSDAASMAAMAESFTAVVAAPSTWTGGPNAPLQKVHPSRARRQAAEERPVILCDDTLLRSSVGVAIDQHMPPHIRDALTAAFTACGALSPTPPDSSARTLDPSALERQLVVDGLDALLQTRGFVTCESAAAACGVDANIVRSAVEQVRSGEAAYYKAAATWPALRQGDTPEFTFLRDFLLTLAFPGAAVEGTHRDWLRSRHEALYPTALDDGDDSTRDSENGAAGAGSSTDASEQLITDVEAARRMLVDSPNALPAAVVRAVRRPLADAAITADEAASAYSLQELIAFYLSCGAASAAGAARPKTKAALAAAIVQWHRQATEATATTSDC